MTPEKETFDTLEEFDSQYPEYVLLRFRGLMSLRNLPILASVIYVPPHTQNAGDIFMNSTGSQDFNSFLKSLGFKVFTFPSFKVIPQETS